MSRLRLLLLLTAVFILLIVGTSTGVWYYLYGTNEIMAAELVPANTVFFATIPNAVEILTGYQSSQLKTLVGSPNSKPLQDAVVTLAGPKNLDLLETFLPNLSGQSFIAVTHFDGDHPEQVGLIAAMKPKPGLGNFDTFLDKLKAAWPDVLKQAKTGTDTIDGVNYDWIQGPGTPDKICVAKVHGWIVTAWGTASLQDWIERFQKKSTTSSLADDLDYRKTLAAVGDDPMTLAYVNCHALAKIIQPQMAATNPAASDFVSQKIDGVGGAALATRFENGEIVDRFSFLMPRPAQLDAGMGDAPCPFETLKFTGPDTRFYWATSINWKQYFANLKDQTQQSGNASPVVNSLLSFLQNWVHGTNLDVHQNIVDALGSEVSVQADWSQDSTWPEAGLFVKLDKPDDFKPTITAVIESIRQAYVNSAVIKELSSNGQNFATLQFVQSSLFSPTITENGPYLGVFLTENQAVRSFQRDEAIGLKHNTDFNRQVGDKRNGAAQLIFLDTPYMLDRAYRTAMPYLSLAGMFNKNLADMLKGKDLPPDLTWLAPMGTWSCIITPDEDGVQGYSVSGIGNQGLLLAGAAGGSVSMLQTMGLLPKTNVLSPGTPLTSNPVTSIPDNAASPPFATSTTPDSIIYVTPDNRIFFDQTLVSLDQLSDFLKSKKAANDNLKILVHTDMNASQDTVTRVLEAGGSAGFGVLSSVQTSGPDSLPPATSSNPDATSSTPNTETNAAPATDPRSNPSTNSAPITPTNSDGTSPAPAPVQTQ